jgi:protein-tyrosine-phosphatase
VTSNLHDGVPANSLPKKKILFICLGNACRSPMAESIARRDAADIIECSSAGIMPLGFVPELTQKTLTSNGCSVDRLESTPITREEWDAADIVINMSGIDRHRAFPDPEKVEDWAVEDPYGADPGVYQTIYEDIRERIGKLAERLRKSAQAADAKQPIAASRN